MPPEHEVTGSNPVGRTHTFMKYMLIMSTTGSKKEADLIAETLVEEKLAACVKPNRKQKEWKQESLKYILMTILKLFSCRLKAVLKHTWIG